MENTTGRMGVGIISAGKVGTALGSALRAAGHTVIGAYAGSEDSRDRLDAMLPRVPALEIPVIVERAELIILAIPDAELAALVEGLATLGAWQPGQIIVHTSARYGTEVLDPAAKLGALALAIHPAMEFSGTSLDVARLAECRFAVSAANAIQPIGLALVAEMGGEGIVVNSADRPIYDAALAHATAAVQVACSQAAHALETIGVNEPDSLVRSLTTSAVDRGLAGKTGAELVTSADSSQTIASQLTALATLAAESAEASDVVDSYAHALHTIVTRAEKGGKLSEKQANELHTMISDLGSAPHAR